MVVGQDHACEVAARSGDADGAWAAGTSARVRVTATLRFQRVEVLQTDGKPGVFATLDAGAARTVGLYFMYDVKQFDPAEWTSPPLESRQVDKPGLGQAIVGRGAVNQKGPQAALLAALHAIRGAGKKLPVNLVLVAEGEEEIGSPHIGQLVHRPEVEAALRKSVGVFMPSASQDRDGVVTVSLGAKGVVELELVSSGEAWGRGPTKDIHSSLKAMVDSPAWRLVKALGTLVSDDGNTITIDNYPKAPPLSDEHKAMIKAAATTRDEAITKQQLGVSHWIDDLPWREPLPEDALGARVVGDPLVDEFAVRGLALAAGAVTVIGGNDPKIAVKLDAKPRALEVLQYMDEELGTRRYIAGDHYSVADITALVAIDFMKPARIQRPEGAKNLSRWHEEVSARPSAKA